MYLGYTMYITCIYIWYQMYMWQASGVADVKEAEKRLKHKLRPLNAWRLIPYFELFLSCPKDELHQWYVSV